MRRLENEDEEKFWEAWVGDDNSLFFRQGKTDSKGQLKQKMFSSKEDAEAELEKLLKQKLKEGYEEVGGEKGEEEDSDEEESDEDESEEKEESDDEEEDDEEDEEEGDDEEEDEEEEEKEKDDKKKDSDDEEEDEEEEEGDDEEDEKEEEGDDEEDEEEEEGDDEEEDEEEEEKVAKKPAKKAEPAPEPEPEPPAVPTLAARFVARPATKEGVAAAREALLALKNLLGKRSHRVRHAARKARKALERIGGVDPSKEANLKDVFDELMAAVNKKPALPLSLAMGLLWEVDHAAFDRAVSSWKKSASGPPAEAIAVLVTINDTLDGEIAVHVAAAIAERALSEKAWTKRWAKVQPFAEEALEKKKSSCKALAKQLSAKTDATLKSRIEGMRSEG